MNGGKNKKKKHKTKHSAYLMAAKRCVFCDVRDAPGAGDEFAEGVFLDLTRINSITLIIMGLT